MDIDDQGGLFLAIEGASKPHVQAQVKILAEKLQSLGLVVETIIFPRTDEPSGYFSRQYDGGAYGEKSAVSPYTALLFQTLDLYQAAISIRKWLDEGRVILVSGYLGSIMADQAPKFAGSEQRSGFYLWSDNMGFEVFNLPRPEKSFVLSTQPKSVETGPEMAFQEVCGLLSRDFQAIDCQREGQILDNETIGDILWQTLEPYIPGSLPRSPLYPVSTSAAETNKDISATGMGESAPKMAAVSRLTMLSKLNQLASISVKEPNFLDHKYYTPPMKARLAKTYQETMDKLFDMADKFEADLLGVLESQKSGRKKDILALAQQYKTAILPVATQQQIDSSLVDDYGEVVSELGSLAESSKQHKKLKDQLALYLPANYGQAEKRVQLVNVWPRNETLLLPYLLYSETNLSIHELDTVVDKWPYDRKQAILAMVLESRSQGDKKLHDILSLAHYSFDLLSDFDSLMGLITLQVPIEFAWQTLTPRYGYAVPALIDEAGLSELYMDSFDISLDLYSKLQAAGYNLEAQYAVLGGHKLRARLSYNAEQFSKVVGLSKNALPAGTADLIKEMTGLVNEVHPQRLENQQQSE